MNSKNIPFQLIDWSLIEKTEHKGETGIAYWQTVEFQGLRIRIVEYSAGYLADHWCEKGHYGYILDGTFEIEFQNKKVVYQTGDGVFIPEGKNHKHRAKALTEFVKVIFIENV